MDARIPHPLFDRMIEVYKLKNDAALSRFLKIPPSNLSRYRSRVLPIGPNVILHVHDVTGWSIRAIKELSQ
jgi:hypothetical protein